MINFIGGVAFGWVTMGIVLIIMWRRYKDQLATLADQLNKKAPGG